ncbi:MAG: carboxypeptidase regulatory-like domain-containing protein [Pyrinomonadaceae bacterium]
MRQTLPVRFLSSGYLRRSGIAFSLLVASFWVCFRESRPGNATNGPPILVSRATSTRAIAMESLTFTAEPFAPTSPFARGSDQRTRIMLFALNLTLQPGEDLSLVRADAEDAAHQRHNLTVEYVGPVPSFEWMSAVVIRLSDNLGDVGDVLLQVTYRDLRSNRVRVGIGHVGDGPPDDVGATPTPAPPYTISGQVMAEGNRLSGVTVALSGAQTGLFVTGESGQYSFTVSQVGDYTITPATTVYHSFASQSINNLSGNRLVNFEGTRRNYTVGGRVTLGPNAAGNLVIQLAGFRVATASTDENGNYSFVLPAGGNYTISPVLPYHDFAPQTQFVDVLSADQLNRNFAATRQIFSIRGKTVDQNGDVLAGIAVRLTGESQGTTVTDSGGNYEFPGLPAGFRYVVTPASNEFYTFASQNVADLSSNQIVNFTGLWRFILSGRVTGTGGNGLIGITVTLSGSESATTTTDGNGNYSLRATATGNYSLTPSMTQSYYTFAPATRSFNNLAAAQTTGFTATLAPFSNPSYVLEFDGTPKTADYSFFWPENVPLGHFFWEFWAMPGSSTEVSYILSDGYGGAHALLFGFSHLGTNEPNRYQLFGDIYNGITHENYFSSDQGPAPGEWGHIAVGWDGQFIYTYFDGVPVGKSLFLGPRLTPGPSGGGGRLLIGGSDHSNLKGRIAQVRGYETRNPREGAPEASFAPQTVFSVDGNLLSYYFQPVPRLVADLSQGYSGVTHTGFLRGTGTGILNFCEACPPPQFVLDPTAPNFATGTPPQPVPVQPPLPAPAGALVFDSFSRVNSTYTFGSNGGLGSTEWGYEGTRLWQSSQPLSSRQPFGILNGRAVLLANNADVAWVQTGSSAANVDIRVDRRPGNWGSGIHTGLSFRVMDARNFFFAYTSNSPSGSANRLLTVGYYINGH